MLAHVRGRLPCPEKTLTVLAIDVNTRIAMIVDCRSVRHIAQGVLAHILGRLPCPKKIPRKNMEIYNVSAIYLPNEECEKMVAGTSIAQRKSNCHVWFGCIPCVCASVACIDF